MGGGVRVDVNEELIRSGGGGGSVAEGVRWGGGVGGAGRGSGWM